MNRQEFEASLLNLGLISKEPHIAPTNDELSLSRNIYAKPSIKQIDLIFTEAENRNNNRLSISVSGDTGLIKLIGTAAFPHKDCTQLASLHFVDNKTTIYFISSKDKEIVHINDDKDIINIFTRIGYTEFISKKRKSKLSKI